MGGAVSSPLRSGAEPQKPRLFVLKNYAKNYGSSHYNSYNALLIDAYAHINIYHDVNGVNG